MVNVLRGESFAFLGFDFRRVQNRNRTDYFILMTPKKKARMTVKARIREVIQNGGAKPAKDIVKQINATLAGWVNYFRVGNSSRAFSEVRDYTEMKIRTLLTRRKRRQKRSIGWRRWSTFITCWDSTGTGKSILPKTLRHFDESVHHSIGLITLMMKFTG